jgi:hypothetical protein
MRFERGGNRMKKRLVLCLTCAAVFTVTTGTCLSKVNSITSVKLFGEGMEQMQVRYLEQDQRQILYEQLTFGSEVLMISANQLSAPQKLAYQSGRDTGSGRQYGEAAPGEQDRKQACDSTRPGSQDGKSGVNGGQDGNGNKAGQGGNGDGNGNNGGQGGNGGGGGGGNGGGGGGGGR